MRTRGEHIFHRPFSAHALLKKSIYPLKSIGAATAAFPDRFQGEARRHVSPPLGKR